MQSSSSEIFYKEGALLAGIEYYMADLSLMVCAMFFFAIRWDGNMP